MPIAGKKQSKETAAKKPAAGNGNRPDRHGVSSEKTSA